MPVTATAVRTPQQSRGIKTRAALLRAGAAAFSELGYAKTTAKAISERAKTATGSFYQYFKNKDVLLRELVDQRHAELEARTIAVLEYEPDETPSTVELVSEARLRIRGVVDAVVAVHREDPGFHAVFTERRHVDQELDTLIGGYERRIIDRIAVLLSRWGFFGDTEAIAFVLFNMLEGSVHAHVLGRPLVSDDRFTDALVESLLRVATPTP